MFSVTSFKASLPGRALRRSGWLILGMMIVLNAMHYLRNGTLGWSDARDSVFLLLIYFGIATLLEYKRQRDAEEAEDAR